MRHARTAVITTVLVSSIVVGATAVAASGATHQSSTPVPLAAPAAAGGGDDGTGEASRRTAVNFVSICNYSHAAADDPIVFPGEPGAAHLHQFFGNTSTSADSTPASMAAAGTTCSRLEDTAAYWVPALSDGGEVQRPGRAQAYYTLARKDPASITAFPHDLRMIAGGTDGPAAATRWGCVDPDSVEPLRTSTAVPACQDGSHLAARVVFPDCWNGVSTDSADHRSHMAYSRRGTCPESHPVALPRLRLTVGYPDADGGNDVVLSSGGPETLHADFLNTWDQAALEQLVSDCLVAEQRCGALGGPGGR